MTYRPIYVSLYLSKIRVIQTTWHSSVFACTSSNNNNGTFSPILMGLSYDIIKSRQIHEALQRRLMVFIYDLVWKRKETVIRDYFHNVERVQNVLWSVSETTLFGIISMEGYERDNGVKWYVMQLCHAREEIHNLRHWYIKSASN